MWWNLLSCVWSIFRRALSSVKVLIALLIQKLWYTLCTETYMSENLDTVATSPVVLGWLCDSPRTGCARRTKIYVCYKPISSHSSSSSLTGSETTVTLNEVCPVSIMLDSRLRCSWWSTASTFVTEKQREQLVVVFCNRNYWQSWWSEPQKNYSGG